MDVCLSLKNGEFLKASELKTSESDRFFLVCPECGEPVYLRSRTQPRQTYFFSHYEKKIQTKFETCSLRAEGSLFKKFSGCAKKSLTNPQLVDRFQKEFAKEIYNLLDIYSPALQEFRGESNFESLESKSYQIFVDEIVSNNLNYELLSPPLKTFQKTDINQCIADVEMFLRSAYGRWVGNFIYQTSYFVSLLVDAKTIDNSIGQSVFATDNENYFLVFSPTKIAGIGKLHLVNLKTSDDRYKSIANIAGLLVSYMVIRRRFALAEPKLFTVSNQFSKIEKIHRPIPIATHDPLKAFRGKDIELSINDQLKVIELIKTSAQIRSPKFKLDSIEKINEWSDAKTPIEGLFLALYKDFPVSSQLTNNSLLLSWVVWAKEKYKEA